MTCYVASLLGECYDLIIREMASAQVKEQERSFAKVNGAEFI